MNDDIQSGPARRLVINSPYTSERVQVAVAVERELCASADAHDAAFAALVEAAEAIDRFNDDWDFPSMLDEPIEFGFIARDLFEQLRAALEAAKGE